MVVKGGSETPWGTAQTVRHLGAGILAIDTASHGGYYVPQELRALIPSYVIPYAGEGWYEEDEDWSIVAVCFPSIFPASAVRIAGEMISRKYPQWASRAHR